MLTRLEIEMKAREMYPDYIWIVGIPVDWDGVHILVKENNVDKYAYYFSAMIDQGGPELHMDTVIHVIAQQLNWTIQNYRLLSQYDVD